MFGFKKKPLVSVLLPVYNGGPFLREAIDSVLSQTLTDFEFIIIDDASTDNSADIIAEYDDRRINFIRNEHNLGLIGTLNKGLGIARGKYIARMDQDDICLPLRLEKQVLYMSRRPQCGVLGTWFHRFGAVNEDCILDPIVLPAGLVCGNKIGHPTVMLRKSVLDKYKLRYDPDFEACEDYELWARMLFLTGVENYPQVLLLHRMHPESMSEVSKEIQLKNTERVRKYIQARMCDNK
ncbi:MAG: glycosyltransferase [Alphaproteobacteria bacterium]|nr:glycosyltransferase [Alphaproteobacteria bacterium]